MGKYYQTEEYNEILESLLANNADLEKINQHGVDWDRSRTDVEEQ